MFVYIYACNAILGVKTLDFLFLNFDFKSIIKRQGLMFQDQFFFSSWVTAGILLHSCFFERIQHYMMLVY